MPTISQLTATSSVSDTDQVPVYSTDNGDARKASMSVLKEYFLTDPNFTDATFTNPVLITPDIGTPSAGNLVNCIGLPLSTGVSGVLGITKGGSGASTADGALTNFGGTAIGKAVFVAANAAAGRTAIGAAAAGANTDITSLAGLTTALSPAQGGTGLTAPGTAGNVLTSNGSAWVSSALATSTASRKTANYTAVAGDVLACDTIAVGAFTITLPASPVAGNAPITIFDAGTTTSVNGFATNNLTIARNGSTIHTLAEDVTVSTKGVTLVIEYINGTWRLRNG